VFGQLPESVSTPELNVETAEGEHFQIMQRLVANARFAGARLITIDGLRVEFEDGWGLVRASNTTPCLVLRFEADDAAALRRIQDEFRQQLLALDPKLQLPF
jgi:phosphomannomutase/phosphoglucomutase